MSKHIQLHIPKPCHENWNNMTPAEKGRFCGSCQKQVVDFTGMRDEQVIAFFRRETTGSVCGRFMEDQLSRDIEIPKKRIPWLKYFFQFALPAFIMTSKVYAQGKVKVIKGNAIPVILSRVDDVKDISKTKLSERSKIIRGKVVNETNEGIPYVSVSIKGTTSVTVADSSGFFEVKYRGEQDEIILASSCLGFQSMEAPVDIRNNEKPITISMQKNVILLNGVTVQTLQGTLGGVRVVLGGAVSVKKCSRKINVKDTLANVLFPSKPIANVYPNPLKSNSTVNIKLGKHKQGMYSIELINLAGQLLLSERQWIDTSTDLINFHVPAVAAGSYLIKLTDSKSTKIVTEKIVVE